MDVGTGKTLSALALAVSAGWRKVLVLAPPKVARVWPDNIQAHTEGFNAIALADGPVAKRVDTLLNSRLEEPLFVVVNYESAWRPPMRELLTRIRWDAVICDEAHRIKAHNSTQSKFAYQLGQRVPVRLALTATPFHNGFLDVFGIARFLEPRIFGWKWTDFKNRYGLWDDFNKYKLLRYINLDELQDKVGQFSFRVDKSVLRLPPEHTVVRYVTMPDKVRRVYRNFSKEYIADVDGEKMLADNILTKLLRLYQLTGGYAVTGEKGETKTTLLDDYKGQALAELLDEFSTDEPIVIFYKFNSDLETLERVAGSLGISYGVLNGHSDDYAAWNRGERRLLFVQQAAGGEGLEFVRARYAIFYSMEWSLGAYIQACGRISRPPQSRATTYFHLTVEDSIDHEVIKAIQKKQEPVEHLMNNLRNIYRG